MTDGPITLEEANRRATVTNGGSAPGHEFDESHPPPALEASNCAPLPTRKAFRTHLGLGPVAKARSMSTRWLSAKRRQITLGSSTAPS